MAPKRDRFYSGKIVVFPVSPTVLTQAHPLQTSIKQREPIKPIYDRLVVAVRLHDVIGGDDAHHVASSALTHKTAPPKPFLFF